MVENETVEWERAGVNTHEVHHEAAERLMESAEKIREIIEQAGQAKEQEIAKIMETSFGQRGWSPRDAQEAYELALVKHITTR